MSDKVINWDLDSFPLKDLSQCLHDQLAVKGIWGQERENRKMLSYNWSHLTSITTAQCAPRHVAPLPAHLVTQESLSYNMCCVQSEPGSSCLRTACWWCRFKISPERKRGWKAWLQKWTPKVLCIAATVRCHLTYFILQLFNRNPLWTACAHEKCHLVNTISQVKWPSHL